MYRILLLRRARRRRSSACGDVPRRALDAPLRGVSQGGGAATSGSPERRRRHADAVEARGHGGDDCGAMAASRPLICGEEGGEAAAELPVRSDSCGEARGGGATRRRRRRPASREREGEGGLCGNFSEKSVHFSVIAKRSLRTLKFGLRVRFPFSIGAFLQKRDRRLCWPSDRRRTAGIGEL